MAVAAAAGSVLFVTNFERGDSGAAAPGREVVRRAQVVSKEGPSLPAFEAQLANVASREAVEVAANTEFVDLRELFPSTEHVALRIRARLSSGGTPPTLVATLRWEGSNSTSQLGPAAPDDSGVTNFDAWRVRSTDQPCVVVLATSRTALSAESNDKVLFERTTDQLLRLAAPAPTPVDGVPTIDLGSVTLSPPEYLGTLRFVEPRADPFTVTVRPDVAQLLLDPRRNPRVEPYRITVDGARHELEMRTFGGASRWSVVVPGPEGRRPFHGDGGRGDRLDVRFERSPGLDVVVDLVQHPYAARAIVLDANAPLPAERLDTGAYDERESGAVRIAVLPLPKRRKGLKEYPLGQLVLEDGRRYRIELWSTLDAEGGRSFLASSVAGVAGDMVDVRL